MGKTPTPGKWIKSLLGKKSSKSSLEKGSEKLRSEKKEEIVVKVKDKDKNNVSNISVDDSLVVSSQEVAATQTVVVAPYVIITEKPQPSGDIEGDLSKANDSEEVKLEEAATKVALELIR